jgi:hypothetical protein
MGGGELETAFEYVKRVKSNQETIEETGEKPFEFQKTLEAA